VDEGWWQKRAAEEQRMGMEATLTLIMMWPAIISARPLAIKSYRLLSVLRLHFILVYWSAMANENAS